MMTKGSEQKKIGYVTFGISLDTRPMEAKSATALPSDEGWQYEPKWDGFRCLAFKEGDSVDLRAKSGKPLGRYFPELVAYLAALPIERFVVDGELVIEIVGKLSFEALQMRLHPADSRIRKLSAATPAKFILFDLLMNPQGDDVRTEPLLQRRAELEALVGNKVDKSRLALSPYSHEIAQAKLWLSDAGSGSTDGVVCKGLDGPYLAGERAMLKVKRCGRRTVSSEGFGMKLTANKSDRFCLDCTTMMESSTTWGSRPLSAMTSGQTSRKNWKNCESRRGSRGRLREAQVGGAPNEARNGCR
ncbi:ATP-dependent DNA ligase [Pararhizobium capsulatum DSM 1112]|uniref:ATP-dependent DNA ligase n=1 Tax=Pararhizobium capsulatum DSM 1112 TaxID=1121113 RepID=A0ABU0BZ83_9HYPH|nr:ATP-dependent DNA ligase [Pararhizobium capsulatum DSM 1112]